MIPEIKVKDLISDHPIKIGMKANPKATCHFLNESPSLKTSSSIIGAINATVARLYISLPIVCAPVGTPPNTGNIPLVKPILS